MRGWDAGLNACEVGRGLRGAEVSSCDARIAEAGPIGVVVRIRDDKVVERNFEKSNFETFVTNFEKSS